MTRAAEAVCLVAVWNARCNRTDLVPKPEACAGLRRFAATLPAGSAYRAEIEAQALTGELPSWPPFLPEATA